MSDPDLSVSVPGSAPRGIRVDLSQVRPEAGDIAAHDPSPAQVLVEDRAPAPAPAPAPTPTPVPVPEPERQGGSASSTLPAAAEQTGTWTAAGLAAAATASAIGTSTALSLMLAVLEPRSVALPLLAASVLLAAALRRPRGPETPRAPETPPAPAAPLAPATSASAASRDTARAAAAAASLPAWAAAGFALAQVVGGGWSAGLGLVGLGVLVGAVAAAAVVPSLLLAWALPALSGAMVAMGGALVALGLLSRVEAAALLGTAAVLVLVNLPWWLARAARWRSTLTPEDGVTVPGGTARHARAALVATSVPSALSVTVCALVLAGDGGTPGRWLAAALAVLLALQARRSRFAVESSVMLAGGLVPLAIMAAGAVAGADAGVRAALVAVTVGALVAALALVALAPGAAARDEGVGRAPAGGRLRPALTVAEAMVALAVVPLLLGVMGVYAAAAGVGASL